MEKYRVALMALCSLGLALETAGQSASSDAPPVATATPSPTGGLNEPLPSQVPVPPRQEWCTSEIFCAGPLLQTVNIAHVYPDDKTFVDKPTSKPPQEVLNDFRNISTNTTYGQVVAFLEEAFSGEGLELEPLTLQNFNPEPAFLNNVTNPLVRAFSQAVHTFWTQLIRGTNQETVCGNTGRCESTLIAKARAAVPKLSLTEKVNLATGVQWERGPCVGNTPAINSINFPGLCLQDGPLGVRFADLVSVFPAAINAAGTFNRTLIRKRAEQLGSEMRGKGIHVALAPAMNVQRVPAGGRNWEAFGADPYLNGEAAYETIIGIQSQGVQAAAKHFLNNEQEHFRESSSSVVDDRTQHEIYAYPFLRSVQANVAAVMCSYNQINGTWACENDKVLNGLLKGEFGFPGYVMSDWWATHSTTSVNFGLDMTMPGDISYKSGTTYFGPNLVRAVENNQVPMSRIDDMATRILAGWYLLKQDQGYPAVNFNSWNVNSPPAQHVNVQKDHKDNIRLIGAASTVLLKNTKNVLPLKNPRTIAIIGSHAGPNSRGINGCVDRGCNDGVLAQGWGSGTAEYPYLINPLDAITARARTYGATVSSSLSDTDLNRAQSTASGKDVAIVFITSDSGEGYITVEGHAGDRNDLKAWHNGDALVQRVAAANTNTIVVVNTVGPVDMEAWIENPNVVAVVWAGLPGQEAGNSLVDILWGDYNPSGRLPYTIGKRIADYGPQVLYNSPVQIPTITYSEGLFIDYRHFDKNNIEPRYEFGYGLSYTTFSYSDLRVTGTAGGVTFPSGPGSSLDKQLHEKVVTVTFTISNTGSVAGHEIPQLYIGLPANTNSPPKSLKGFDSVFLQPNQSKQVTMELSRFDLAIWDTTGQRWRVPSGTTSILVGASSRDIRLRGSVEN